MIDFLKNRFGSDLPGKAFQNKMAHAARLKLQTEPTPPDAKASAVLVLLYPKNAEWHLALIERAERSSDRHGGQVSFPGGGYEEKDGDLLHCALRETFEEVGVRIPESQVIGEMTDLYIPVSGYRVVPFLAYSETPLVFKPSANEVRRVLETPISLLQNPDTMRITDLWVSEKITLQYVPYYAVQEKKVWGATAMIISELLEILKG